MLIKNNEKFIKTCNDYFILFLNLDDVTWILNLDDVTWILNLISCLNSLFTNMKMNYDLLFHPIVQIIYI